MSWTKWILPLAALAVAGCSAGVERRDSEEFPYGQVSLVPGDEEADHPAAVAPVRLEAALDALDMASVEFAGKRAPLLDDPERLRATAAALARGLASAGPRDRVALSTAWTVGDPESLHFQNELEAEFAVRGGELLVVVRRFEQAGKGGTRHPLRALPREGTAARLEGSTPPGAQTIVIPLDE